MATMIVELEWNEEELGEKWMNIDNFRACLYGQTHVAEVSLQIVELDVISHIPYSDEVEEPIDGG